MSAFNESSIKLLVEKYKDDREAIMLIQECLMSFSKYFDSIYFMETYAKIFGYGNVDKEEYQQEVMSLDKERTSNHNRVISSVSILNRLCENNEIPLIYDGVISEEKPFRREIADACLGYVVAVIQNRK